MKKLKDFKPSEIVGYKTGVNPEINKNYSFPIYAREFIKFGVPADTLQIEFNSIIDLYF